ncbi:MAG: GNAT family N-acetyltransferase [bacterium]|nr:GNAT family N-acetyltransferase [bacterium]
MDRTFFLKTNRIGFSKWSSEDMTLAQLLWGNPQVTKYICASGKFTENDIAHRLDTEIFNETKYHVQYWPLFELATDDFIGCCGLRPHGEKEYEMGFHLRPTLWGQGYAQEAAIAVINYAFTTLKAKKLFAGHNPNNVKSQKLLNKLGFVYIGDIFFEPTGLFHPSYEIENLSSHT